MRVPHRWWDDATSAEHAVGAGGNGRGRRAHGAAMEHADVRVVAQGRILHRFVEQNVSRGDETFRRCGIGGGCTAR